MQLGDAELSGRIYFDHDGGVRPSDLVGLAHTTLTGATGSPPPCLTDGGQEATEAATPEFDAIVADQCGHLSENDIDLI
ncbi:MAG: hypothetical protein U9N79_06835 [Actinomycetota bacterium]|nr:hypothetical protein [Actinomycetota bacterium]